MDCLYLGCELARNILYIRHNGFEVLEQGIALSSERLWIVVEAVFVDSVNEAREMEKYASPIDFLPSYLRLRTKVVDKVIIIRYWFD